MAFIRIKKIHGQEYAYLVENKWYKKGYKTKGRGSRQGVSKYLGKVFRFPKSNEVNFQAFKQIANIQDYLASSNEEQVIIDLVLWELFRHNIKADEFSVEFRRKTVTRRNREVTLRMNEGFLNSFTLRRLLHLESKESLYLAKRFIEAGIEVPQEIFVGLFSE